MVELVVFDKVSNKTFKKIKHKMKVRLKKCSNPKLWYYNLEPFECEVVENRNLYRIISGKHERNYLHKDDFEIIGESWTTSSTSPDLFEHQNNSKRVFESGAIRNVDTNKVNFVESLSFLALKRYSTYMRSKQDQMGEGNWKKGIPIKEYEKSLLRHLNQYFGNKYEGMNDEPDCDHLSAAFFNLQGLIHEIEKLSKNESNNK